MNLRLSKTIGVICSISLILSSILSVVDYWCFNNEFYKLEYEQLSTAQNIGMSVEDLDKTTNVLLDYLKDRDLTLEVQANINGVNRQVFNEREIAHMVDVRDLYLNAMNIKNICYVILAFSLFILTFKKDLKVLYGSYTKTLLFFLLVFICIGIFCAIDFNSFWTSFHHVFFNNDLWLLDPRTDILIMMVPSKFFFDLCVIIVVSVISVLLLYLILLKIIDKKVIKHD